jgi:hypothetical protein
VTGQASAAAKLREGAAKLRAVGARVARRLAENLVRSGGAKLLELRVNALAVRQNPCVAVNHG